MGRYTQRRRAASGPAVPTAPPPPSLSIVSIVSQGGGNILINFSGSTNFVVGSAFGLGLTINGQGITDVFGTPPPPDTSALCGIFGATINPGDPWVLSSQPSWITDPIALGSGTVT